MYRVRCFLYPLNRPGLLLMLFRPDRLVLPRIGLRGIHRTQIRCLGPIRINAFRYTHQPNHQILGRISIFRSTHFRSGRVGKQIFIVRP